MRLNSHRTRGLRTSGFFKYGSRLSKQCDISSSFKFSVRFALIVAIFFVCAFVGDVSNVSSRTAHSSDTTLVVHLL